MAKFRLKKLPKAPKASSSNATKESYLKKVAEVKRQNAHIMAEKKRSVVLDRKIREARASFRKAI